MTKVILLDSGPLGMVSHPAAAAVNERCRTWMEDLLNKGVEIVVPQIIDYELRRELLRARARAGIARLDAVVARLGILPLDVATMERAADFWAKARRRGRQTAHDNALDIDMLLCAQAAVLARTRRRDRIEVATTNTRHVSLFSVARDWYRITS